MNTLDRNIKDILQAHPAAADTLNAFGIGCVTCNVGTCRLRDIVEIHNLTPEREAALFDALAAIIAPGTVIRIPAAERKMTVDATAHKFSPPLARLVEEHTFIKRLLARVIPLTEGLETELSQRQPLLQRALEFIRGYADTYHHAKEEDILFGFFDPQSEVVAAFRTEHEQGRGHVREAAAALQRGDGAGVREHLRAYAALLQDHIRKEDELLYPWMDRRLTDSQVGRLFAACAEVEERFGSKPKAFELWIEEMERTTV